jgi:energy-coupling factor transporter ATP-binding protein EcfA2
MSFIKKIYFKKLKRLENVIIEFPERGVIALMGENGSGKSTVLHALASLYRPHEYTQVNRGDYGHWWTDYFIPHTGNLWMDSRLRVTFSDRADGTEYGKKDRWYPRKGSRRERYNRFIGLLDCAPHIEIERQRTSFTFNVAAIDISPSKLQQLISTASNILNKRYISIQSATKRRGLKAFTIVTIEYGQPPQRATYTSHYMGAGEYKTLRIVEEILRAPNDSLLLIEELEVSMHDAALRRLIPFLVQAAETKNMQIVVTTHWPGIIDFSDIYIRTLHTHKDVVTCINGYKPMALHKMTGNPDDMRLITIWVEDDLAYKVASQVSSILGIAPNIKIKKYGVIDNSFAVATSLQLDEVDINSSIVLLDGDKYRCKQEKLSKIQKVLSGTEENIVEKQNAAADRLIQFCPVLQDEELIYSPILNTPPEKFLIEAARVAVNAESATDWVRQFIEYVDENVFEDPSKSAIWNIHLHFGQTIDRVQQFLIEAAATTPLWTIFTGDLSERLSTMATNLNIDLRGAA